MIYRQLPPSSYLSQIVKHFWSLDQSADEGVGAREPVLPDGCTEIVFNLSDQFRRYSSLEDFELQPRTLIAGQMTRSIVIGPSGNVRLFGVRFHPLGAYNYLRMPMSDFTDRTDAFDLLAKSNESVLHERLVGQDSFAGQISIFEDELLRRTKDAIFPDQKLTAAVDALAHAGVAKISDIASYLGWSERKLERDIKKYLGLSPKMFVRVSRFSSIVRAMETRGLSPLVEHANEYGYYDQSHMINEFREFSGESPSAFYKRSHRLSELFTVGE